MNLHMKGTFPLKRTNNVETTKEHSHKNKNPMYLNLCCEWTIILDIVQCMNQSGLNYF
jgi:hypothetical protein